MNRSLRRAHLRRSLGMALLLPLGLGAALWSREAPPIDDSELSGLHASSPTSEAALEAAKLSRVEFSGLGVALLPWYQTTEPVGGIELVAERQLAAPDVLVYWSAVESPLAPGADLAPDAMLLGTFPGGGSRHFDLPAAGQGGGGQVLLYSLGHGEVLGALPLDPLPNP